MSLPATDEAGRKRRHNMLRDGLMRRYSRQADLFRDTLLDFYGEEKGKKVRHAQAFEICEYGARPTREDLKRLFPFFSDQ